MPAPEEFQTDSFCNNWVVGSDRFKTTIYDDRRFNESDAIGSSNLVKAKLLDVNMYSANGAAMVTVPYGCLDVPVATVEAYGFDRVGIVGVDKGASDGLHFQFDISEPRFQPRIRAGWTGGLVSIALLLQPRGNSKGGSVSS